MGNPAVSAPATLRLPPAQRTSQERIASQAGQAAADSSRSVGDGSDEEKQNGAHAYLRSKNDRGWRRIVRHFSPSWFSVTMGTGICSTILYTIPWQEKGDWLWYLSIVFFLLNVVLFAAAATASILRYTIWPEIWTVMIQDSVNSLFLGTIPMGFATLVEMWVFICVPAWGRWAAYVAWALWMVDALAAVSVTLSLGILLMSASDQRSLDSITAAQLLPIAATIVAAGTGAEVAEILPHPQYALGTVIACYVLWGMAVPMAFSVLVIYFHRLALHKMPPRTVIVSAFLPLGPLGFGGYTILYLGRVSLHLFPETGTIDPLAGRFAYIAGLFMALIMWGWGLVWLTFALASIYKCRPSSGMGLWGYTFPLGVYSVSTMLIGEELPSLFFRVLGTIFGVAVILLWMVIAAKTAKGAWDGTLFFAPCLANLERGREEEEDYSEQDAEMTGANGSGIAQQPRSRSSVD